ncbi:MAG: PAS domain S-box protein [Caldilineaceae bacterium]
MTDSSLAPEVNGKVARQQPPMPAALYTPSQAGQPFPACDEPIEILRQREARYRRLLENLYDPICCFQADFTLTFANPAYSTLFGKSGAELVGHSLLEIIPAEYQPEVAAQLAALTPANPVATSKNPVRLADGALRWFQWTNRLILDEHGQVVEYQGSGRDITAQHQAEARESEQRRMADVLRDTLTVLTGTGAIDSVMQQILAAANTVVASEAGSIILFEEDQARVAYLRGYSPEATAFFQHYRFTHDMASSHRIFAHDQPYWVPDTQDTPDWVPLPVNAWIRSSLGVPIGIRGQTIGLLVLDSRTPHHFQPTDVGKLQAFAQYASLALENAFHVNFLEERVAARTRELQAAKEQVEAILYNSPDAILLLQPDLQIKQTNPVFTQIFGTQANHSFLELIDPADVETVATLVERVTAQQTGARCEIRAYHNDGTLLDVELSIGPVKEAGLVCILRDITGRKEAERLLAEERNLLRTVIDTIPDVIFVKDLQHRFVLCNHPPVYSIRPSDPNAYLGKTDFDLHPPQVAERFRAEEEVIFTTGNPVPQHELKLVREDGSVIWLLATKVPLRNQQGEIIGLAGISHEITALKWAMDAYSASEKKFRQLIETMDSGFAIYDAEDCITYANERYCALSGYPSEELLGTAFYTYVDAVNAQIMTEQRVRRRQGESTTYELIVKRKDGQRAHWLIAGSPLYDEQQQMVGSFAVVNDITLQKQAEAVLQEALRKEKELSELKSRFVSMASHEFRTPLTAIFLMADTLLAYRHRLTAEQVEQRLQGIREQGRYLKAIMEDVLELATIQAGQGKFEPLPLALDVLCRTVLEELQSPEILSRLHYDCDGPIPPANLDRRLMHRIIINLVTNALKYSPLSAPVMVRLTAQNALLRLQVQDQGIGIPPADLPYLFQPFHRASNVGDIRGTGLGLVITKEAVDLHGGTISVTSQLGEGTTFTVTIPTMQSHEN